MDKHTIYQLRAKNMAGEEISLEQYRGKVVLIVNTASRCGQAPQLEKLEELYQTYKDEGFIVLGFPCGQFAGQEPLDGHDIAEYCQINYGVTFPMFDKVDVRGPNTHPVFRFMASREKNGKFSVRPWWNYYKFLVGRDGKVIDYWITYTQPDVPRIGKSIERALEVATPVD